jgi:hypothetical protein
MTGSQRDVHVEERACRILKDDHATAAYADFVDGQLRGCRIRALLGAGELAVRVVIIVTLVILSVGILLLSPAPGPARPPMTVLRDGK